MRQRFRTDQKGTSEKVKNPCFKDIREKKETTMEITTAVKASIFVATLGFACLLTPTARAQADAMPNPDEYPFSAPATIAVQPVTHAGVKEAKADFEGKISLPYDVNCGGKNLKAGQYLVSVESEGSNRVVTIHGGGENMKMRVHRVPANRGTRQSALLVRRSADGRNLEAVYIEGLNATFYVNQNSTESNAGMERLPIS
jgi:hypothetical protein